MIRQRYPHLSGVALALWMLLFAAWPVRGATYAPPNVEVPLCNTGVTGTCTDLFGYPNFANTTLPSGTIVGFTMVDGGAGYAAAPAVTVSDPDPLCGAQATAVVAGGAVSSITLTVGTGGSCKAPQVAIAAPPAVAGARQALATADIGAPFVAGTGIRKFVDTLPGLCPLGTNGLGQCLPLAQADTTTFPGSDYYHIGLNDYAQKMHSDLPPTKLRGYLQLDAAGNPVTLAGSPTPHQYLGPLILATKDRPVRVKFSNLLGTGNAGDLFIPVDTTYMGAGMGPDGTWYTQNRATLHLHGGLSPWISDGTPHQWTTPVGENSTTLTRGASVGHVPDMWFDQNGNVITACGKQITCNVPGATNDPGAGRLTFYWTNAQSGRLLFYHDHAYGITRLNVYAGEAAGYLIVDPLTEDALRAATVPGTLPSVKPVTTPAAIDLASADLTHVIPLVIQDKSFVPQPGELAAEDPTWNTAQYGTFGNLWLPHVYVPNQNPADPNGVNGFGRWDYGAWFWPNQTSLTAATPNTAVTIPCTSSAFPGQVVECPIIPNPSGTPESFMDTPLVNGTAYPVLHVAPEAYRFQILSAGNDRAFNLQLYYAATAPPAGASAGTVCKGNATASNLCTEVNMVPAAPPVAGAGVPPCAQTVRISNPAVGIGLGLGEVDGSGKPINGTGLPANCWPSTWPTDGRAGGVPDPTTAGPPFVQIGNESGPLPAPVVIPSTPVGYEYMRRSITVLNVATHGLFLGTAERADVVVDFSQVPAGSTLILYNDSPAPVPGFDARLDYFTGNGDQTASGGAPNTQPGYGPNTRTIMQIVVDKAASGATPFNINTLQAAFASTATTKGIYAAVQDPPVIPQTALNSAFNGNYVNNFSTIYDTSLAFNPAGDALGGITLTSGGSGYTSAPLVTLTGGTPTTPASASATITQQVTGLTLTGGGVTSVTVTAKGSGYLTTPTVTLSGGGGTGATARANMVSALSIALTNGGTGYTTAPTVTFTGGGATSPAAASATITSGLRTITLSSGGSRYATAPTVTFTGGGGTGAAASATIAGGRVTSITITNRGSGYTTAPTVTLSAPATGGTRALASATISGFVNTLTLTNPGIGYLTAPTVGFTGGGGTGAAASATVSDSVASVTVTNAGSGYSTPPTVTFTAATGSGAAASATIGGGGVGFTSAPTITFGGGTATASATLTNGTVSGITVTNAGNGYANAPAVTIDAPPAGGVQATASAGVNLLGVITGITITNGGSGYTAVPRVIIAPNPNVVQASATATIGSPAAVATVNVGNMGSGYTASPAVTFSGGGGSGAAATANLTNGVTSVTMTNPGSGYTVAPGVVFAPPTAVGGVQATGNANLNLNGITRVTINNGGSRYTTAPTVTITDALGNGAGATATATVAGGRVTAVTVTNPGAGYVAPVTVAFTGGGGTGATASATIANTVTVTITNPGSGYTTAPVVVFTPPAAGTTAAGTAVMTGIVSSVTVTNSGSGYTTPPVVTIAAPVAGVTATASATLGAAVNSITITNPGSGFTTAPTVTISGGGGSGATALATISGAVSAINITNPGSGFTAAPTVTIAPPTAGTPASAMASLTNVQKQIPKAIHELFTTDYGRMNALLGTELPLTSWLTQTTIPLSYIDPPTEIINQGESQIWKITHNGVDTHFIHFHLFDVQVINRMGWDGTVKPPDENEIGWKDTVRMNPLEDITVALRPRTPPVPFPLWDSVRPLDVTMPLGTTAQFTGIDPFTNNPITVTNALYNYGWEYVWHCHILGHEENDMMRPVVYKGPSIPAAPSVTAVPGNGQATVTVSALSVGTNPLTSYSVTPVRGGVTQPAVNGLTTVPAVITGLTNCQSYTFTAALTSNLGTGAVSPPSNTVVPGVPPAAPTALNATAGSGQARLTFTAPASTCAGFAMNYTATCVPTTGATVTLTGGASPLVVTGLVNGTSYSCSVTATNPVGTSPASQAVNVTPNLLPPTGLAAAVSLTAPLRVTLSWAGNGLAVNVQRATNAGFTAGISNLGQVAAGTATFTDSTAAAGLTYYYRVQSVSGATLSVWSAGVSVSTSVPATPTGLRGTASRTTGATTDQVALTWTANGTNIGGFTIQRSTSATFAAGPNTVSVTAAANLRSYTFTGLNRTTRYYFRILASNGAGSSAYSAPVNVLTP